jgi:hypothetical protein
MLRTACSLVFVCTLAAAMPVAAQDPDTTLIVPIRHELLFDAPPPTPRLRRVSAPPTSDSGLATDAARPRRRPAALVPLYAGFATLQALDYASTTRALSSGAGVEGNPMMRSIVGNRAAFIAVKAAATAGVILAGEKVWKKNRVAAVILVAAMNAALAPIVAHNYAVR